MNWLAHIFLSELNIDFQIGNFLADPLKGKAWENASLDLKKGIKTHLLIDSFTDSNEIVIQSKKRLRDSGLLKAIVIDITYDYFLTKNWDIFCNIPFEEFTKTFYEQARNELPNLPIEPRKRVERIVKYQVLNKYQSVNHLKTAFERIDKRLSPKLLSRDCASSYFEGVSKNIEILEEDFLIFFPKLCKVVRNEIDENKIPHWKLSNIH